MLICIGVIAVIVGIYSFINRPQAQAKGSIDTITSVDLPTQNSDVVAMNVSIYNTGEKPFYIRNISAEIQNDAGTFTDKALSPMDFDRYYQAFPDLKKAPLDPLKVETKIEPGSSARGTMIVIFPVSADAFAHRKTLRVIVQPYDQPVSLVLTK